MIMTPIVIKSVRCAYAWFDCSGLRYASLVSCSLLKLCRRNILQLAITSKPPLRRIKTKSPVNWCFCSMHWVFWAEWQILYTWKDPGQLSYIAGRVQSAEGKLQVSIYLQCLPVPSCVCVCVFRCLLIICRNVVTSLCSACSIASFWPCDA